MSSWNPEKKKILNISGTKSAFDKKKIKSILEASSFKNHHLLQLSLDKKKQLAKKNTWDIDL